MSIDSSQISNDVLSVFLRMNETEKWSDLVKFKYKVKDREIRYSD